MTDECAAERGKRLHLGRLTFRVVRWGVVISNGCWGRGLPLWHLPAIGYTVYQMLHPKTRATPPWGHYPR